MARDAWFQLIRANSWALNSARSTPSVAIGWRNSIQSWYPAQKGRENLCRNTRPQHSCNLRGPNGPSAFTEAAAPRGTATCKVRSRETKANALTLTVRGKAITGSARPDAPFEASAVWQ